ncbi:SDR family NAD(P)-dependent oxidoreductase [Nakamurella sp. YIM 132087]|uniref:SDR family NAD(P)-dependent oxidoreductase n=1 Tax=Nakamurella alba TaxID=2665158 RepID=A0A7K1FNF2_9ACTN|nr:SDR family NAD(P)-dependent oxidoreductase [Nakamurella alba]MTD15692.1 SDR family NAD(P)-dependent oxidoreductase [Nakamurella alba]
MSRWHRVTTAEDLTGRRAVVTGANTGLGFRTALDLAALGAHVTLAVRRPERGEQAAERIRRAGAPGGIDVAALDLGDLATVHRFARDRSEPVDVLVNNAGLMMVPRREITIDGFESQMGVNHLGHFALTALLYERLSPDARVVSLSSIAHRSARRLDHGMGLVGDYDPATAYGQSKLAVLLFTAELHRRLAAVGSGIRAVAAHPGWSATAEGPAPQDDPGLQVRIGRAATALLGTRPAHGARSQVHAASASGVRSGDFWGPRFLTAGMPHPARTSRAATDPADAEWLWAESERLTGVLFRP